MPAQVGKKKKKSSGKTQSYIRLVVKTLIAQNKRITLRTIYGGEENIPGEVMPDQQTILNMAPESFKDFVKLRRRMIDDARKAYLDSMKPPGAGTNTDKANQVIQSLMAAPEKLEPLPAKIDADKWQSSSLADKWKHMTNQTASYAANPYALNL